MGDLRWMGKAAVGALSDPRLASFVNGRAPNRARAFLLALHDLGLDRRCPKGKSLQACGQDFQLVRRTQLVEMVNARLHGLKVLCGDVVGRDGVTLTHWPPPLLGEPVVLPPTEGEGAAPCRPGA